MGQLLGTETLPALPRQLLLNPGPCSLPHCCRRKSVAPDAAAANTTPAAGSSGRGGSNGGDAAPSTSGRRAEVQQQGAPPADGQIDYAEFYRQAALKAKQEEQASILRRLKG